MGMGHAAAAASFDAKSLQKLMAANCWWFILAQRWHGSFYYQPNRDNAGDGGDSRLSASAATAFSLSLPGGKLRVSGFQDK